MPGPASIKQLVKFARVCEVGASARTLTTHTSAMANLLSAQASDDQMTYLARHGAGSPGSRFIKPHFFAFGGVSKTARWINAVAAGKLTFDREAAGFEVEE